MEKAEEIHEKPFISCKNIGEKNFLQKILKINRWKTHI